MLAVEQRLFDTYGETILREMGHGFDEAELEKWFSSNCNVEVHAFLQSGKYCVVNNTYVPQSTTVYTAGGSFLLDLEANEIRWYEI